MTGVLLPASQLTLRGGVDGPTGPPSATLSHAPGTSCTNPLTCNGCLTPFARELDALHARVSRPPSIPSVPHATIKVSATSTTRRRGTLTASSQLARYHAGLIAAATAAAAGTTTTPRASTTDDGSGLTLAERLERPHAHARLLRLERPRASDDEAHRLAAADRVRRAAEGAEVLSAMLEQGRSRAVLDARIREGQRLAAESSHAATLAACRYAPTPASPFYASKAFLQGSGLEAAEVGASKAFSGASPVAPLFDPLAEALEASHNFGRPRSARSTEAARSVALEFLAARAKERPLDAPTEAQVSRAVSALLDPFSSGSIIPEMLATRQEALERRDTEERARQTTMRREAAIALRQAAVARTAQRTTASATLVAPSPPPPPAHPARGFVLRLKDAALPNKLLVVARPSPRPATPPNPHVHPPSPATTTTVAAAAEPGGARRLSSRQRHREYAPLASQGLVPPPLFDRPQQAYDGAYDDDDGGEWDRAYGGSAEESKRNEGGWSLSSVDGVFEDDSNRSPPLPDRSFLHSPRARELRASLTGRAEAQQSALRRAEGDVAIALALARAPSPPYTVPLPDADADLLGARAHSVAGQHAARSSRTRHWETQHALRTARDSGALLAVYKAARQAPRDAATPTMTAERRRHQATARVVAGVPVPQPQVPASYSAHRRGLETTTEASSPMMSTPHYAPRPRSSPAGVRASPSSSLPSSASGLARTILAHLQNDAPDADDDNADTDLLQAASEAASFRLEDVAAAAAVMSENATDTPPEQAPSVAIFRVGAHLDASGSGGGGGVVRRGGAAPEVSRLFGAQSAGLVRRPPGPVQDARALLAQDPSAPLRPRPTLRLRDAADPTWQLEPETNATLERSHARRAAAAAADAAEPDHPRRQPALRNNAAPASSRVRTSRTAVALASRLGSVSARSSGGSGSGSFENGAPLLRAAAFTTPTLDGAPFRVRTALFQKKRRDDDNDTTDAAAEIEDEKEGAHAPPPVDDGRRFDQEEKKNPRARTASRKSARSASKPASSSPTTRKPGSQPRKAQRRQAAKKAPVASQDQSLDAVAAVDVAPESDLVAAPAEDDSSHLQISVSHAESASGETAPPPAASSDSPASLEAAEAARSFADALAALSAASLVPDSPAHPEEPTSPGTPASSFDDTDDDE